MPRVSVPQNPTGTLASPVALDALAPGFAGAATLGQLGDLAPADDHIVHTVDARPRVDHARSCDHDLTAWLSSSSPVEALDRAHRVAHAGSPIGVGAESSGSVRAASLRGPLRTSNRIAMRT